MRAAAYGFIFGTGLHACVDGVYWLSGSMLMVIAVALTFEDIRRVRRAE